MFISSASTPSTPGSKPINRSSSFNCSPITNAPSGSKATTAERMEPKLLKPLGKIVLYFKMLYFLNISFCVGPTYQSGVERKASQEIDFESRPMEDKLLMLYMAIQQQHFINIQLKKKRDAVLKEADVMTLCLYIDYLFIFFWLVMWFKLLNRNKMPLYLRWWRLRKKKLLRLKIEQS